MDWSTERYVRVYRKDTPRYLSLSFEAQALLWLILRKLDRNGEMDLGGMEPEVAVALVLGHRERAAQFKDPLRELIENGTFELYGEVLRSPNFVEAQENDAARDHADRQKRYRERKKALQTAESPRKVTSRDVTHSHGDVTVTPTEPSEPSDPYKDSTNAQLPPPTDPGAGAPALGGNLGLANNQSAELPDGRSAADPPELTTGPTQDTARLLDAARSATTRPEAGPRRRTSKRTPHPDTQRVIAAFCDSWKEAKGEPYVPSSQDGAAVKRELGRWQADELIRRIPIALQENWFAQNGTLAIFCAKANLYSKANAPPGKPKRTGDVYGPEHFEDPNAKPF